MMASQMEEAETCERVDKNGKSYQLKRDRYLKDLRTVRT